jgi:ankyrin repeat protein
VRPADIELVRSLLEQGVDPNAKGSPLHLAAYQGNVGMAKLLLEHKADPNIASNENQTPLSWATVNGNTEIVKLLLEYQADPNIADDDDNWTPLHLAASNGNTEIVKLLLKHGADKTLATKKGETAAGIAQERGHNALATLIESYIPSLQHMILHKIRREKIDVSDPNIPPGILEY